MRGPLAPEIVLDLLSCKCTKECKTPSSLCNANGLKCTEACRLTVCSNSSAEDPLYSDSNSNSDTANVCNCWKCSKDYGVLTCINCTQLDHVSRLLLKGILGCTAHCFVVSHVRTQCHYTCHSLTLIKYFWYIIYLYSVLFHFYSLYYLLHKENCGY